jgi:hypothetical protein
MSVLPISGGTHAKTEWIPLEARFHTEQYHEDHISPFRSCVFDLVSFQSHSQTEQSSLPLHESGIPRGSGICDLGVGAFDLEFFICGGEIELVPIEVQGGRLSVSPGDTRISFHYDPLQVHARHGRC